jgi:hypothetical protein
MERRAFPRIQQSIPCEVVQGGRRVPGMLVDVSPGGAFLQVESTVGIGEEVEIWFADACFAPQVAKGKIVRRRLVSGLVDSFLRSGLGVAWIEAPAFATQGEGASDLLEVEVDASPTDSGVAVLDDEGPVLETDPGAEAEQPPALEVDTGADVEPDAPADEIAELPVPKVAASTTMEARPAAQPDEAEDLLPAPRRADVVVIDEGELSDVAALIAELGTTPDRLRWGAPADSARWTSLPRLVIASARVALNVPIDASARSLGVQGVAVCDSPSLVLRTQLHRQGYHLITQRAAHPETLRLFFGALLHKRHEHRREKRRAFGAPARVWHGILPYSATILDVTRAGASVLMRRSLPRGTKLSVRVSGTYTGGRALALAAQVERVAPHAEGAILGLRFVSIPARKMERLRALIARLDAAGPIANPKAPPGAERRAPLRAERRAAPRRPYRGEVLTFDDATGAVRDVLVGTDLSLGGMRIEAHPGIARGQRLRIALQPSPAAGPIVIGAEVLRDEGPRGLVLRFVDVPESTQSALRRLLGAVAEVQRAKDDRSGESERLVLGRLLSDDTNAG